MDPRAILALLFAVIVWGIGPVFIRTLSVDLGAADHLAIRFTLVSIIYLVILGIFGGWRIDRSDWLRLLLISTVGMVGYNLGNAFGFERVSAGIGSLIIGTQPLLIALLGTLIARERLSPAAIIGLILGFVGVALLVWKDLGLASNSWDILLGSAMIFASGVSWAVYVIISKPLVQKYGALSITSWSILIGSLVMVPVVAGPTTIDTMLAMDTANWLEMAFIAIISNIFASIAWNFGVSRTTAAACGAFLYLVPIIGVISGALILAEPLTVGILAGGVLILAGVAIAQFSPQLRIEGRLAALLAILFAVSMWGLIPVAMRFLVLELSPPTAMVLRLYPAGILAVVVLLFVGVRKIEWLDWLRIAIAAFAGNLGYQILAAYGMQTVPASWTGMIFGLEPVFIALFSVMIAAERLTFWLVGGIFVAMLGTGALMFGSTFAGLEHVSLFGLVLVTISTMGWGIYTVVIRPASRKYGALQVACIAMAMSAIPMPLFVGFDFPQAIVSMGLTEWAAVGFVVIFGTFLATSAWNYALGHMESSIAGIFLYVQPVVATIGGILLLGESLTLPLITGGALIILGVAIAQIGPLMQRRRLAPRANPAIQRQ